MFLLYIPEAGHQLTKRSALQLWEVRLAPWNVERVYLPARQAHLAASTVICAPCRSALITMETLW